MKRSPVILLLRRLHGGKESPSGSNHRISQLLRSATHPKTFSYVDQLTNYLKNNFILHEPGRFLIIPKPYGVSCVGEPQQEGGVFENSVFNRKDPDEVPMKEVVDKSVTISECIPGLSRLFNEPQLMFCTGLKRYLSGAIVLPACSADFENIKNSIKYAAGKPANCSPHYRALALLVSSPPSSGGSLSGYATFQSNGKVSEYIFVEQNAGRRARTGKFAVAGSMEWRVLSERYGCSLVEFTVDKFARHLPRLMFSHMLCPILGDELYGNRLIEIDGKPATVQPKDLRRVRNARYFPRALTDHLGVTAAELQRMMPLFCHVHSTFFPRYGWKIGRPKREQDYADLYANVPPPQHFLAMAEALGMNDALMKYFQDDDDDGEQLIGGDEKF
uniref:PseudoU_synth_2 domain-containing protein n=1 Tax=Haemonchus contortus TaxID=6289 RepID=A0A7I4YVB7_HAECO